MKKLQTEHQTKETKIRQASLDNNIGRLRGNYIICTTMKLKRHFISSICYQFEMNFFLKKT
jgi:hypothetical protein